MTARLVNRAVAPTVTRETTGERLRRLRLAHGWTQVVLADRAGVCVLVVSRAENDATIYAHNLAALAQALDVSMDYLYLGRAS